MRSAGQRASNTRTRAEACRPTGVALAVVLTSILALAMGCAPAGRYVDSAGVDASMVVPEGEISGTLIGYEEGVLLVDRAYEKSVDLRVVRLDGVDVVYLDDVPIGPAVEVRDFDVVVRERIPLETVEDARVRRRALFGWGTLVAAALTFALVQAVQASN